MSTEREHRVAEVVRGLVQPASTRGIAHDADVTFETAAAILSKMRRRGETKVKRIIPKRGKSGCPMWIAETF